MRKLATAAAVSLALASGGAFGLGLGDIEMRSALNQPMNAEIRLTSVKSGELDGMIVQLASPDAFARAGIERSPALTDLRFTVDQSSGVPVIRISSQRPVIEPFLNFLLEVDWPQGRMVREYTVLLDPPVFMTPTATERNTTADQPAIVERGNEVLVAPTPIERVEPAADEVIEVELVDVVEETGDQEAVELLSDGQGDIVSLDSLSDESLLLEEDAVAPGDGDIVPLTDLAAPNLSAIEERELAAQRNFDLDNIEVEIVGSTEEVSDNVVIAGDSVQSGSSLDDSSTIVSLDDLALDEETAAAPQPAGQDTAAGPAGDVEVRAGDTLFEIARDNAVGGVSVQQMMMALLAANEAAFINNNINLVRAGAILRVPQADEALQLTQTQALAAIGEQTRLWQEYRDNLRNTGVTRLAGSDASVEVQESTASTGTSSDTTAIDTAALDAQLESEESVDGLSAEAREILENARNEILDRDELRIVADNAPTSTTASATADETSDSDAARLGELNRKLQLAREELASTRLQSEDLSDQASDLQSTTENLDALVTLRQNEIAALETQLADARQAREAAATTEAAETANAGEPVAEVATDATTEVTTEVADSATEAAQAAGDTVAEAAADASDAAADAVADASDATAEAAADVSETAAEAAADAAATIATATEGVVDSSTDALATGELPDEVADSEAEDTGVVIAPPARQTSWYQDLLDDPKRMMIAGVGGIGLLGVLGTLMIRRRRNDEDELREFADDVEHLDGDGSQAKGRQTVKGAGLAAAGGTGVAAADDLDGTAVRDPSSSSFDDLGDSTLAHGSETQAVADATSDDGIDKDDTLSEVDVYLAYGLHGQAEELLTKAIERKPNNPEYVQKLLQTYHAQGNGEGFHAAASDFHLRFDGEANPQWPAIAAMGTELRPGDPLYASARDAVNAIGVGHSEGTAMGDDDFPTSETDEGGSVSRDFRSAEEAVDFEDEGESQILDQSLDPAFAFDESDLEATGDFSDMASELASEDDGSIDFPGIDASESAAAQNEPDLTDKPDVAAELPAADGQDSTDEPLLTGDAGSDDLTNELSADLTEGDDFLSDALTMDELDRVASADDLTLDLDQLSGDLELDSAELMNSDLSDLDLPELSADNELLIDSTADGDGADEMDTMLDLAKAYIDMGDKDSASSALGEIVKSGSPEQVTEAETLLRKIS